MGLADDIRDFDFEKYIKPARELGTEIVTVRAGDIHEEIGAERETTLRLRLLGNKKVP